MSRGWLLREDRLMIGPLYYGKTKAGQRVFLKAMKGQSGLTLTC